MTRSLLLLTMLVASATGCNKLFPPPVVFPKLPVDHPSLLVNPPYPGTDWTGAQPTFSKMYAVGSGGSDSNRQAGIYQSSANYTLQRGDGAEINPEEVAAELRRWIAAAPGVTVTATSEDSRVAGRIHGAIEYETADTIGHAVFLVEPATLDKKVRYEVDIRERRR